MQRNLAFSVFFISSLILIRCAPKIGTETAKQENKSSREVNRTQEKFNENKTSKPGEPDPIPMAALNDAEKQAYQMQIIENGKLIWSTRCKKCHELYPPHTRNAAEWEQILEVMAVKAELDETSKSHVKTYLFAGAKK